MDNVDKIRISRCSKKMQILMKLNGKDTAYNSWTKEERKQMSFEELNELFHLFNKSEPVEFRKRFRCGINISNPLICYLKMKANLSLTVPPGKSPEVFECKIHFVPQNVDADDGPAGPEQTISTVPIVRKKSDEFHSYWRNELEGFIATMQYFELTFGCRPRKITIQKLDYEKFPMYLRNIIERLKLSQFTLKNWGLYWLGNIDRDDFSFVLQNINTNIISYCSDMTNQESRAAEHSLECILLDNVSNIKCAQLMLGSSYCVNGTVTNFIANWLLAPPRLCQQGVSFTMFEEAKMEEIFAGLPSNENGELYHIAKQTGKNWRITAKNKNILDVFLTTPTYIRFYLKKAIVN